MSRKKRTTEKSGAPLKPIEHPVAQPFPENLRPDLRDEANLKKAFEWEQKPYMSPEHMFMVIQAIKKARGCSFTEANKFFLVNTFSADNPIVFPEVMWADPAMFLSRYDTQKNN